MQLIAGHTAQEYNLRKHRKGAYWEDRYHATAVDTQTYLARCMRYIDLNMVRAGVVTYPQDWQWCGYCEIQSPPQRYAVINTAALLQLFGLTKFHHFQKIHNEHPFVAQKVVSAEILEITPAKADERLQFLVD